MSRYAEGTSVDVFRSRAEIERTLARYGAEQFAYGVSDDQAVIGFRAHHRFVRFTLPLPSRTDPRFTKSPAGRRTYSPDQRERVWEQACRESWRALALCIKAKLEAVAAGITTFEEEFLAHIVVPGDGRTVGQVLVPQLADAYTSGRALPPLLPASFH